MRFDDLNFTIEFDKDIIAAMNLLIPSMIIQPYVENAIKHGLLHKKGDKQLFIKIKSQATI
jgi:two-component system LytT family sensor kinase